MTIGERIKHYRTNSKMTQKKLSELTGIHEVTIRQYEANKYTPKIENILKISKALGISYTDLAPNTLIFDATPDDILINHILKKHANGETLTSEESELLRTHIQRGAKRASEVLEEMVSTLSKDMVGSVPPAIEAGRKILEDSKKTSLLSYYDKLNSAGKTEAIKRIEELTYIPLYISTDEPPTTE